MMDDSSSDFNDSSSDKESYLEYRKGTPIHVACSILFKDTVRVKTEYFSKKFFFS